MKRMITWLRESNRWKHLIGGMAIGALSDDWYCAALSGVGIASALEYKDKTHGGTWDWIDWGITMVGVIIGYGVKKAPSL